MSTGDFTEALQALLGPAAPGFSATTITRLKSSWEAEYKDWNVRSLKGKQYVYVWADAVYFNVRLEGESHRRQCTLVLMGGTAIGKKEPIAITYGYRESEQSWRELLLDVRRRGVTIDPQLATADGALRFWAVARKIWPATRDQYATIRASRVSSRSCGGRRDRGKSVAPGADGESMDGLQTHKRCSIRLTAYGAAVGRVGKRLTRNLRAGTFRHSTVGCFISRSLGELTLGSGPSGCRPAAPRGHRSCEAKEGCKERWVS